MANVLVVGANRGIGYYLAERLLQLGNTVTVLDIQIQEIEILKEKYQKALLPIIADARSLSAIDRYKISIGNFSSKRIYGKGKRSWIWTG